MGRRKQKAPRREPRGEIHQEGWRRHGLNVGSPCYDFKGLVPQKTRIFAHKKEEPGPLPSLHTRPRSAIEQVLLPATMMWSMTRTSMYLSASTRVRVSNSSAPDGSARPLGC